MPRYYFGFENKKPDTEGEELPDDNAARKVALIVAEEMGRHLAARPVINIFTADGNMLAPTGKQPDS